MEQEPKNGNGMKPNQVLHADNLAHFTGFYGGRYYHNGIYQEPKEKKIARREAIKKAFPWMFASAIGVISGGLGTKLDEGRVVSLEQQVATHEERLDIHEANIITHKRVLTDHEKRLKG